MTTALFNTLFDEVLIDVPGVSQDVALNAIRNAAIEFCEKTSCWVVNAAPITSIAAQAAYSFVPDVGTEVAGIEQAWYNGVKIEHRSATQLEAEVSLPQTTFVAGVQWNKQTGTPKYYTMERPDQFILVPYPDTGITSAIEMKLSIKPSRTATVIEKWVIDKHFETLAHGAKYKLFAMHAKPWSSADQSIYHRSEFEKGVTSASSQKSQKLPAMINAISPI